MTKTWYLGPLGDLRPLVCPEPDIKKSLIRYGGVHQGLSGARTVDVTGHRMEYEFEFSYLERDEYAWLEAMHSRLIPGPFRLIDPMKKNRLSAGATALRTRTDTLDPGGNNGINVSFNDWRHVRDYPPNVLGTHSLELRSWTSVDDGQGLHTVWADQDTLTAVHEEETITGSWYVKATAQPQVLWVQMNYYGPDGVPGGQVGTSLGPVYTIQPEDGWQRVSVTETTPPGVAAVRLNIYLDWFDGPLRIAAPQLESGPEATDWEMGGAEATVHIDQLETTSPRFPLSNCTLTLLEA